MGSFDALNDHDLELLVADLLAAKDGTEFEVFPRGRDLGIDLRGRDADGGLQVVQVKHYERSSFADLLRAAADERVKLARLDPQPKRYRFVTSKELTVPQKDRLARALDPYIADPADIVGGTELDALISRYPAVERRHQKLWLRGSTQLLDMVHADVRNHSRALVARIEAHLPVYVRHRGFDHARRRLHGERVLVIAGVPGVGKTTLAEMLLADALHSNEYDEPVVVSQDVAEAWRVFDPARRQVILYDDFLGHAALERLRKNESGSLVELMKAVVNAPHTLFLMTTREYILRHAIQLHQELEHEGVEERRYLLHLKQYSLLDRAQIFISHACHSGRLSRSARETLLNSSAYMQILQHPNYTPRTIAHITGTEGPRLSDAELDDYLSFALATLDDPGRLWSRVFRRELGNNERALLLALACGPGAVKESDLRRVYERLAGRLNAETGDEAFNDALRTLDGSMLTTSQWVGADGPYISVAPHDDSVVDYLLQYLAGTPEAALACLHGAVSIGQIDRLVRATNMDDVPGAASQLAEAVRRTYPAPAVVRLPMFGTPPSAAHNEVRRGMYGVLAESHDDRDLSGWRLLVIHELMQRSDELALLLDQWWHVRLAEAVADPGNPESMLQLAYVAKDRIEEMAGTRETLKRFFTRHADGLGWLDLADFRDLFPDAFTASEWERELERFIEMTSSELSGGEAIVAVMGADRLGVDIPESIRREARAADESMSFPPVGAYEPPDDGEYPPTDLESQQVHDLFTDFVDDGTRS
jgi:Restriction endonuclease